MALVEPQIQIRAGAEESRSFGAAPQHLPRSTRLPIWDGRSLVWACLSIDALALLLGVVAVLSGAWLAPTSSAYPLVLLPPIAGVQLLSRGGYAWGIGSSPLDAGWKAAAAVASAAMCVVVLAAITGDPTEVGAVAVASTIALAGMLAGRALLSAGRRRARMSGAVAQPALVVGSGAVAQRIARRLLSDPSYGLRPVGFVDAPDADDRPLAPAGFVNSGLPIVGGLTELRSAVAATGARHVIIAFSSIRDSGLGPVVRDCEQLGVDVSVVPRLFDAINGRSVYQRIGGLPLIGLRPTLRSSVRLRVKRIVDLVTAACALVVAAPLFAILALAVRLDSPGPVFYRQRRLGRDGQVFDVLKFRSMRVGDSGAFVPAPGSAPGGVEGVDRRTALGRMLRRSSLDELPQLVNILRGEMSLVGPRPERPEYAVAFARDIHRYDDRLRVRSGLTGWAQVNGYRGQTSIEDRVEWDNYYIEHWSLALDVRIMFMTVITLFRPSEG